MAIVRMTALQDATGTAVATTCGLGTVYDLGAVESCQTAFAALHLLTSAVASTNVIQFTVYSASSSGAGFTAAQTLRFTFTALACRGSEWGTPVTGAFATCQRFWATEWVTSCAGVRKALVEFARACV